MEEDKGTVLKGNQSIHRCFDILELLVASTDPLSIKEIAGNLQMSLSAVHALLFSMIERGYVEHLGPRKGYVLGHKLSTLCMSITMENQLVHIAKPVMEQLLIDCDNETCYLAHFQKNSVQVLLVKYSTRMLGLGNSPTKMDNLHAASMGKLLLAYMPPKDYEKWKLQAHKLKAFTGQTIVFFDLLDRELERVRQQGYAINNQESDEGVYTMAFPIFNHLGKAVACVAAGMPLIRYSEKKETLISIELEKQARYLSEQLGYTLDK